MGRSTGESSAESHLNELGLLTELYCFVKGKWLQKTGLNSGDISTNCCWPALGLVLESRRFSIMLVDQMRAGADPFVGPLLWYAGFMTSEVFFFLVVGGGGLIGTACNGKAPTCQRELAFPLWWVKKNTLGWKSLDVSRMEAVFWSEMSGWWRREEAVTVVLKLQLAVTKKLVSCLADSVLNRLKS